MKKLKCPKGIKLWLKEIQRTYDHQLCICKKYLFGYVIEKSATTSFLTYAEEQDRTENLNQNSDLTCKIKFCHLKNFSLRFLIKKKISGLLARSNIQHN